MADLGQMRLRWAQGRGTTPTWTSSFLSDKKEIPHCVHTPSGIIWGKRLKGSFINIMELVLAIWLQPSIMRRELGLRENDDNEEHGASPLPRTRKPWPLLKLSRPTGAESSQSGSDIVDSGPDCDSDRPSEENIMAFSNGDSLKGLLERACDKDWPPGRLEIVLDTLDPDEPSHSGPSLIIFPDVREGYFRSELDCKECEEVGAYACAKCTVELPAIVSSLRYSMHKEEFVENSGVQRFNPLEGKYGKIIAALWLDGSLTGELGTKILHFPGDPSYLYCTINLDCKACGGKNSPDCEECGIDNAEPIYARFDENGKAWVADVNGNRVTGTPNPVTQQASSNGNSDGPLNVPDNEEEAAPRLGLLGIRIFEDRDKQEMPQIPVTLAMASSIHPTDNALDDADTRNNDPKLDTGSDITPSDGTTSSFKPLGMPPSLEEAIPSEYLPDILLVNDADGNIIRYHSSVSRHSTDKISPVFLKPFKFKRVLPYPVNDPGLPSESASVTPTLREAELHLSLSSRLGKGNHSDVYLVPMRLPDPLSAGTSTGEVAVACKMARMRSNCCVELLENEAKMYASFPDYFFEGWRGYNVCTPKFKRPVPPGPIVPKFYGYYKPMNDGGYYAEEEKLLDDVSKAMMRDFIDGLSPILLMEHCGQQISRCMRGRDKDECLSLLHRLHLAEFTHGSAHMRNVLIQPGPLTEAPSRRNMEQPSFRLVDFGRTELKKGVTDHRTRSDNEIRGLRSEIGMF